MIIIFHLIASILGHLLKKQLREAQQCKCFFPSQQGHPLAQRDAKNDIKFDPPVFKQRYERAADILTNPRWKSEILKIVDFGSAELGLFVFLKNSVQAEELMLVDIDDVLLRDHLYRVYPLNVDYLIQRQKPLHVKVYSGSAADPDESLLSTDAVVALEIIEHLYPDVLEALPYNIFSYIRPMLVVITTPNADFNVLFEKVGKFRHEDHKFEWSRDQFQSWAVNLTVRFPEYAVYFDGVGLGPGGSENLGSCSQLALFIRKDVICDSYAEKSVSCSCNCGGKENCSCTCKNCAPKDSFGICTYQSYSRKSSASEDSEERNGHSYKLIASVEYPYEPDIRTDEEKNLDELRYRIGLFANVNNEYYNFERNCVEIPLTRLAYKHNGTFPTDPEEIRALLLKYNYQIEERLNAGTSKIEIVVVFEPEMDSGSSDNTDASGYESDNNKYNGNDSQLSESDWDDKDLMTWNTSAQAAEVGKGKQQQEAALLDSGYQKSPSAPDESPNSSPVKDQSMASGFKNLNAEKTNKFSNILSVFNDFDKINELDAVRRDRKHFSFSSNLPYREVMKKLCQEIAKQPVAGPSRENGRSKQSKKLSQSSDSEDSADEVRSITTCIIENSLNRIECKNEQPHVDIIHELVEELAQEENPPQQVELPEPLLVVENGDLANNNRDREGNNYPENQEEEPVEQHVDNDNVNIERNNVNVDNNNEIVFEDHIAVPIEPIEEEYAERDIPINVEVAWSSREALFDANSELDLLEDFEIDEIASVNNEIPSCIIVNSGNVINEAAPEDSSFPNWLLQIFEEVDAEVPEDELHGEPHFYCQGDGLGVHPSIIAVNAEEDDADTESISDTTSSSSGSSEFQSAENQPLQGTAAAADNSESNTLVLIGQPMIMDQSYQANSAEQEAAHSVEESESNLVVMTGSCTQ